MRIMNRLIFVGLVGVSVAGCAQTRSKMTADGRPSEPVAIAPLPSLHESINRGMGGKQVRQSALKDATDPRWAGRAPGPASRDAASRPALAAAGRTIPIQKLKPPADFDPSAVVKPTMASKSKEASSAEAMASTEAAASKQVTANDPAAQPRVSSAAPADVPGPEASESESPVISANGLIPVEQVVAKQSAEPAKSDPEIGAASLPPAADAASTDAKAEEAVASTEPAAQSSPASSAAAVAEPVAATLPAPSSAPVADAVPAPATASEAPAASLAEKDPLLGPNPSLTPAVPAAAPAELEVPKPALDAQPKPEAVASPPATEPSPAPVPAPAQVPAPVDAPAPVEAPALDPLLGPNPSLTPSVEEKPKEEPKAAAAPAEAAVAPVEAAAPTPAAPPLPPVDSNESKPATPAPAPSSALAPSPPAGEETEEVMPIVGKAVDENGDEFGLPKLPETIPGEKQTASKAAPTTPKGTNPPAQAPAPDLAPAAIAPEASQEEPAELPPLPADKVSAVAPRMPSNQPASDPGVRQVSAAPAEIRTPSMSVSRDVKEAGRAAARVGEEVITLNEVVAAVKEFRKKHPSQQPPSQDELNMIARGVLMMLIERSLLTQEAKRVLKNPKMLEQMMKFADKAWSEEELPPLYRKYLASNPYELKEKMAAEHRSLDVVYDSFRQDFLAQAFLHQKIGSKLKADLPDMLKYYEQHKGDTENQRPATIVWREILVENGKYASPQEARKKAENLRDRLRKGENFASIAKVESDGPSLSKSEGGRMETSPGSYAVPSVNKALETLPPGSISDILEGPTSMHIVVVEKRQPAGPVSFEEIQDQISKAIREEKIQKERIALITKLRRQTLVWTIFDNTASDPNLPVGAPAR